MRRSVGVRDAGRGRLFSVRRWPGGGGGRPWYSAGVDDSQISTQTSGGHTTVSVHAETTLPLEDAGNRDGFAVRAAKILWRTHLGRVDTLKVTTLQRDHPESRDDRTWQHAELEREFGARLAGLDAGDETALRQHLPPGDGPYANKSADRLPQATTVMQQIVGETTQDRLGTEPRLDEREQCLDDFGVEPTGEFRAYAEADLTLPPGTQPLQILEAAATQWAQMGLEVDRSDLFTGNEDEIHGTLPGIGGVALSEYPHGTHPGIVGVSYGTECHHP